MSYPTIQRGSRGDAVRQAQQALIDRGYDVGLAGADGIFGIYTHRAVLNYQFDRSTGQFWALSYPLAIDGIVGPQTWGRLAPATIRKGSKGAGVRLLQSMLKDWGMPELDPGPIDGIFGHQTEMAVENFQAELGLVKDGIVGPVTWRRLWS